MEIFKKQKYIYTKYEDVHIKNLKDANVPYEIREEMPFFELFKKGYIRYSAVMELIVIGGLIWAIFFK